MTGLSDNEYKLAPTVSGVGLMFYKLLVLVFTIYFGVSVNIRDINVKKKHPHYRAFTQRKP